MTRRQTPKRPVWKGSATVPVSLLAGEDVQVNVPVLNALVGKDVHIGIIPGLIASIYYSASVSAPGNVAVNILNLSGNTYTDTLTLNAAVDK